MAKWAVQPENYTEHMLQILTLSNVNTVCVSSELTGCSRVLSNTEGATACRCHHEYKTFGAQSDPNAILCY